jgi:NitT/TauT family transport system substrate-binding protein
MKFLPAFALVLFIISGCGRELPKAKEGQSPALTKVSLQLNWYPEVEHGGFYAALVHGYFKAEGLDVEILPGALETPVVQNVANGRCAFGVINADRFLFGRAQQAPVVALMAPLQTSPLCLIVHEASGIRSFSELKNMTIAMTTTRAFYAFLRAKVPLENVQVVPYGGSIERFLTDANYAQQGYSFSEPFLIKQNGGDPYNLMLAELGFNPYTSLLFTTEATVEKNPELARRMVRATVKGWRHYLRDPSAANAAIQKLNPAMDKELLAFGAKELRPLVLGDLAEESIGRMTLDRWQTLVDQLVSCDQMKADAVKASDVFTNQFLAAEPATTKD